MEKIENMENASIISDYCSALINDKKKDIISFDKQYPPIHLNRYSSLETNTCEINPSYIGKPS